MDPDSGCTEADDPEENAMQSPGRTLQAIAVAALSLSCLAGKTTDRETPDGSARPVTGKHVLAEDVAAKAVEACPELLALRQNVDRTYARYLEMSSTRGLTKRKKAQRELPALEKQIDKCLQKMEAMCVRELRPEKKRQSELQEAENKLLDRLDRLAERGRDTEKERAKLDALGQRLEAIEEKIEVLETVARPTLPMVPLEEFFFQQRFKLNEQRIRDYRTLAKRFPDFASGRLYIEDLKADVEAAEKSKKTQKAEALERKLKSTLRRFRPLYKRVRKELQGEVNEMETAMKKLGPRVERTMGKRSGKKYQAELSRLEQNLTNLKQCLSLVDRCAEGVIERENREDEGNE